MANVIKRDFKEAGIFQDTTRNLRNSRTTCPGQAQGQRRVVAGGVRYCADCSSGTCVLLECHSQAICLIQMLVQLHANTSENGENAKGLSHRDMPSVFDA